MKTKSTEKAKELLYSKEKSTKITQKKKNIVSAWKVSRLGFNIYKILLNIKVEKTVYSFLLGTPKLAFS